MDKLIFKIYFVDSVLSEFMPAMKQYFGTDTPKDHNGEQQKANWSTLSRLHEYVYVLKCNL